MLNLWFIYTTALQAQYEFIQNLIGTLDHSVTQESSLHSSLYT